MRFTPGGEFFPGAPLPQSVGGVEVAKFTFVLDGGHGQQARFWFVIFHDWAVDRSDIAVFGTVMSFQPVTVGRGETVNRGRALAVRANLALGWLRALPGKGSGDAGLGAHAASRPGSPACGSSRF